MKRNNKKGFTLIELLAVIVILGLILVITVPKVTQTINNSKKRTLELTVRSIAKAAEEKYIENDTFGLEEEITCESVAGISNNDYSSCIISFDEEGIASVTITGKGRYKGLNVCSGDKIEATATSEECSTLGGTIGVTFIEELLANESTLNNGLIQTYATVNGKQVEAGVRYAGPLTGNDAVKNKVYFNCKDKDSDGVDYGANTYDYASSCEVWRIIGVFDTKEDQTDTIGAKRIKIVRDELSVNMNWDSSASGINSGVGVNQWGPSGEYLGADLMRMLNGYYIVKDETCKYCDAVNQNECPNDCSDSVEQLTTNALNMIDSVVWNLGAPVWAESLSSMYEGEISDQNGKACSLQDGCNDEVVRTTKWVGKIGLIYPSDYAYASITEGCFSNIVGVDSLCKENNWLHPSSGAYWVISPTSRSDHANSVWAVGSTSCIINSSTSNNYGVRPSVYLDSKIKITGGDGNEIPYKLSV